MSQVSCSDDDKDWFDEWAGDRTQSEAFGDMVSIVRAYEGEPVDHDQLAERLDVKLGNRLELAAYNGAKDGVDNNVE